MKLVIGAGERRQDGWTHHDIQPLKGIDILCDFWDLPASVEEKSCEEIQITHVLEHFPMAETKKAIELIKNLLTPGGKVYIEVPNFAWHAEQIVQDPRNRQVVEYAYGGQLNQWDFHYNGFTPEILAEDLEACGLRVVNLQPFSSIECTAVRV